MTKTAKQLEIEVDALYTMLEPVALESDQVLSIHNDIDAAYRSLLKAQHALEAMAEARLKHHDLIGVLSNVEDMTRDMHDCLDQVEAADYKLSLQIERIEVAIDEKREQLDAALGAPMVGDVIK